MWATDATQITTVQDGKVWLFAVAEHWKAELLGWQVAKSGTRFEATQALGMAARQQFGHLAADAARYNAEWLIENNGYLSPLDASAVWLDTCIRRAA